ncbi:TrmH family RNA methyltransferase, partial [Gemmiger formicilis]|uniref:TrmH family RNA methyltransferase n=1 Tax=Gemmiger formicilis TaxID=745368 RepID=UPI0023DFBA71
IGSEGQGLRDETVEACDAAVRIPMTDRVESLNAGVAGRSSECSTGSRPAAPMEERSVLGEKGAAQPGPSTTA